MADAGPAFRDDRHGNSEQDEGLGLTTEPDVTNVEPQRSASLSGSSVSQFSTGLVVDSDADSALYDVEAPSSTQSLRPSIYESIEEYGRTYHKYKQGKYWMPNDEMEQERLDLQHAVFVMLLKGKLFRAPLQNPQSVLDIGTGTGIWAIDFALQYPSASVLGTDLSPIQPEFVPPNCHFEIDDCEDEWIFSKKFDFIHLRLMWHSFKDVRNVIKSAFDFLNPGGYIEFQDYFSILQAIDDSMKGTALERLIQLYVEAGKRLGRDMLLPRRYKQWLIDAGFVEVVEEKLAIPGNPWPKGKEAKTMGFWQMTNFSEGVSAISMFALTKGLGMSVEEVELLLVDVRKCIKDTKIHFYCPTYIVYGRKPEQQDTA